MLDKFKSILMFVAFLVASSLFTGCGGSDSDQNGESVAVKPPPPIVVPTPEPPKEKPVYRYEGDKFKDPFIPAGYSSNYSPEAVFDPKRASVKAVIYSARIKSAILTVGAGVTYFVKDSRVFDIMGKTVAGFTAKVMEDRVVLIGEDENTYELKIQRTDKEEKSS